LIDINALFGIRSVRQQKRIEVVVQLEDWDNTANTTAPARPAAHGAARCRAATRNRAAQSGKNLTVICEVVAMTHLLRYSGVDSANAFNERLIRRMRRRGAAVPEEDYE